MACILTVDDSLSIRKMLSLTLGSAGFDVVQAVDGLDALEMANQHNFDDRIKQRIKNEGTRSGSDRLDSQAI